MVITIDNAVPYLLEKKIINVECIVDGDLKLVDASRKNRNLKVIRKYGASVLMKQPNVGDIYSATTIQREARLYDLIYNVPDFADIRSNIPRFLGFDPDMKILMIEFVNNSQTLNEYYYDISFEGFPEEPSSILGNIIAAYHSAFNGWMDNDKLSFCPKSHPLPFFIIRPGPDIFSHVSPANLQLLKIIQKYPDISNPLSTIHRDWHIQTLIHGDMKWDNVLVVKNNDNNNNANLATQMKIVDWELCDLGDPCWDIGAALQDFISFWLFSLPITGKEKPDQLISSAHYPLQNMKNSIRAFWRGYTKRAGIKGKEANELLYKSTRYCAARLIHKAYESQQKSSQLSNTAVYMLQTSLNIFRDIDNAIIQLFGIPYAGDWS